MFFLWKIKISWDFILVRRGVTCKVRLSEVKMEESEVKVRKEKWCNGTQGGTQDGTQSGTQDTQDDTEGDTQMIPKNKLLTSSTIPYLPKTKLGSLLITSKLPLMYERRILVLLLKSYIQYILCIYVYMYSRIHEYTF